MKKLIVNWIFFITPFLALNAQVLSNPVVTDTKINERVNLPSNPGLIDQEALARMQGAYGTFELDNGISFSVAKEKLDKSALKTKKLKKKSKDLDDYCTRDFFETSGQTSNWSVYPGDGTQEIENIVPGAIYDLSELNGQFFKRIEGYKRNKIGVQLFSDKASTTFAVVEKPNSVARIFNNGVIPISRTIKNTTESNLLLNFNFDHQYSEKEMNINLGGAIPYPGGKVKFNNSNTSKKNSSVNTYLLEWEEEFYTLEAAGKNVANKTWFVDETLNSKPWGYVASVTYGRRIVVVINSTYSYSELQNHFSADSDGLVEADGSFDNKALGIKDTFSYSIYIMGNKSSNNDIAIATNAAGIDKLFEQLNDLLAHNDDSPKYAVPIKFTLNDLNGDVVATTYSPVESKAKSCDALYAVRLNSIDVLKKKDNIGKKLELYGSFRVTAYNDDGSKFGSVKYNSLPIKKGAVSGVTQFAKKENTVDLSEDDIPYSFKNSSSGGTQTWRIPYDALNGYFTINIDAFDKDTTSKDDEITESSEKFYFKDLSGFDEKILKARGDGNTVKFAFEITRLE